MLPALLPALVGLLSLTPATAYHTRSRCSGTIMNGGFDSDTVAPWTITSQYPAGNSVEVTQPGYESTYGLTMSALAYDGGATISSMAIAQNFSACSNYTYQAGLWYDGSSATGPDFNVFLTVAESGRRGSSYTATGSVYNGNWQYLSLTFPGFRHGTITVGVTSTNEGYENQVWMDSISIAAAD